MRVDGLDRTSSTSCWQYPDRLQDNNLVAAGLEKLLMSKLFRLQKKGFQTSKQDNEINRAIQWCTFDWRISSFLEFRSLSLEDVQQMLKRSKHLPILYQTNLFCCFHTPNAKNWHSASKRNNRELCTSLWQMSNDKILYHVLGGHSNDA